MIWGNPCPRQEPCGLQANSWVKIWRHHWWMNTWVPFFVASFSGMPFLRVPQGKRSRHQNQSAWESHPHSHTSLCLWGIFLSARDISILTLSRQWTGPVLSVMMSESEELPVSSMNKRVDFHFSGNTSQTKTMIKYKSNDKAGRGRGQDVYLNILNIFILKFLFVTQR